eukprot:SAG31_NODE_110_length_24476_cov_9.909654_16_plen_92_part_00
MIDWQVLGQVPNARSRCKLKSRPLARWFFARPTSDPEVGRAGGLSGPTPFVNLQRLRAFWEQYPFVRALCWSCVAAADAPMRQTMACMTLL